MHAPRPYGLFGADGLGAEDLAAVDDVMRNITNARAVSGVASLKAVRVLPGGGTVVAVDMGGVFKAYVNAPEAPHGDGEAVNYGTAFVPMLFCGVVLRSRLAPGELTAISVTETTRKRLAGYDDGRKAAGVLELNRFIVPYSYRSQELLPPNPGIYTHTQYEKLHPTWFSGAMANVVQIAAGYGRQDFKNLPEDPIERAKMQLPEKLRAKVEAEIGNVSLPGCTGIPPESGQIQFDYKFNVSNGVSFGADKKPWLVQIDRRGVYCMPLPMVPATTTKEFKEWVAEKNDDELLWAIERFGGLPSGEGFPTGARFGAWERAGVIIKVCDAADFYSHYGYYSACGWSFNSSGTQACNTCLDLSGDIPHGLTYALRLSIGNTVFDGRHIDDRKKLSAIDSQRLVKYVGTLLAEADPVERSALRYKLRRVPASQLLSRASSAAKDGCAYWVNYMAEPIATIGGQVVRTERGPLWWPGVKFPEPMLPDDALITVPVFRPDDHGGNIPKCDTTVFVYHIGDDLKVVKNFNDPRGHDRRTEGNFEEEMYVGSWEKTEYVGVSKIHGPIYITDIDEREEIAPDETTTTVVGADKGYGTPYWSFHAYGNATGDLYRWRYYEHNTRVVRDVGKKINTTAVVPFLCRDAVIYASVKSAESRGISESNFMGALEDPYSYGYWTYDEGAHWIYADTSIPRVGVPSPTGGEPIWATIQREPIKRLIGGFSDSGPWINVVSDVSEILRLDHSIMNLSGGGKPPPFAQRNFEKNEGRSSKQRLSISIFANILNIGDAVREGYFKQSPDQFNIFFYVDASRNAAGSTIYASVDEAGDWGRRKHFGYSRLVDHSRAHYFIGVVNE